MTSSDPSSRPAHRRRAGTLLVLVALLALAALAALVAPPGEAASAAAVAAGEPRILEVVRDGPVAELTLAVPPAAADEVLDADAFDVVLNGSDPVELADVVQVASSLEVAFVVDPALSAAALEVVKEALSGLVDRLPDGSRVGVVSATEQGRVLTGQNADDAAVDAAIGRLTRVPDRNVYRSVGKAVAGFTPATEASEATDQGDDEAAGGAGGAVSRRVVIVVAAGGYGVLPADADELRDELETVTTYIVGLDRSSIGSPAPRYGLPLGGGRTFTVADGAAISDVLDEIGDELLSFYRLSFPVPEDDLSYYFQVAVATAAGTSEAGGAIPPGGTGADEGGGASDDEDDGDGDGLPLLPIGLTVAAATLICLALLLPPWLAARRRRRRDRTPASPDVRVVALPRRRNGSGTGAPDDGDASGSTSASGGARSSRGRRRARP